MIKSISAVLITRDAANTIVETLDSLKVFEEVIVYDNGSKDRTCEMVEKYPNVRLVVGEFDGYGTTKNRAVSYAKNNLIFSLDADEVMTPGLLKEVKECERGWLRERVGEVKRLNYFMGRPVRFGDWGNDRVVRLYDRREYQFCQRMVHESITTNSRSDVIKFRHSLKHNTVVSLSQTLQKIDRYSELYAEESLGDKKAPHPFICLMKSKFAFFRSYILRGGFLDGWRGLIIAYTASLGVFYKYAKPYTKSKVADDLENKAESKQYVLEKGGSDRLAEHSHTVV